mgnify:CR=1 FL=1
MATSLPTIEEHLRHRRPYDSVLDTIGWTPLIRLSRIAKGIRTPVYGKADFFNPGGSVKDRIGIAMIDGWPHCPAIPETLVNISRPSRLSRPGAHPNPELDEFRDQIAQRGRWAMRRCCRSFCSSRSSWSSTRPA